MRHRFWFPAFFRSSGQTPFQRSSAFPVVRNLQRESEARFPACKIRDRQIANLRACTRLPALHSATRTHRDAHQIKPCATVRRQENQAVSARASLLRVFDGARVRILTPGTMLRGPVRSPGPGVVPRIPTSHQRKSRWYPIRHSWKGRRRCAANLLQSGGWRASTFPCAPPLQSFRPAPVSDPQPRRCQSERRVRRGTWESYAIPRESLPGRSRAAFLCASARSPHVPARARAHR